MTLRPRPGRGGPHAEHLAAQVGLTLASPTTATPVTLTPAQERAFRNRTQWVVQVHACYAAVNVDQGRLDRRADG